jgi:hypothetical protein
VHVRLLVSSRHEKETHYRVKETAHACLGSLKFKPCHAHENKHLDAGFFICFVKTHAAHAFPVWGPPSGITRYTQVGVFWSKQPKERPSRGRGDEGGGGGDESREMHGVLNVFLRPARKNIDLKLP